MKSRRIGICLFMLSVMLSGCSVIFSEQDDAKVAAVKDFYELWQKQSADEPVNTKLEQYTQWCSSVTLPIMMSHVKPEKLNKIYQDADDTIVISFNVDGADQEAYGIKNGQATWRLGLSEIKSGSGDYAICDVKVVK